MSFKIGDILKGQEGRYGVTNENMYEGIVTNVYLSGDIEVKVLKHKENEYINDKYDVDPKYFELVRSKSNRIDQILEMLGLELNEEFEIVGRLYSTYKITESGLVDYDGDNYGEYIWGLLTGAYEIKKLPWTPKKGELFFFYDMNGIINNAPYTPYSVFHKSLALLGNCARTANELREKEAEIKGKFEIDEWDSF